jgi:hypothetical protein
MLNPHLYAALTEARTLELRNRYRTPAVGPPPAICVGHELTRPARDKRRCRLSAAVARITRPGRTARSSG